MKKYYIISFIYFVFILSFAILSPNKAFATPVNHPVTGYAWSSNIGWIKFDSNPTDPVVISVENNKGVFYGYAWSSNIGWISFYHSLDPSCPIGNGSCPQAEVQLESGRVTGWARACAGTINGNCSGGSRTDGWDGWIELSGDNHRTVANLSGNEVSHQGVSYNKDNGRFSGYAWGGNVVGWIDFNGVICAGCANVTPPTINLEGQDINGSNDWRTNNIIINSDQSLPIRWKTSPQSLIGCLRYNASVWESNNPLLSMGCGDNQWHIGSISFTNSGLGVITKNLQIQVNDGGNWLQGGFLIITINPAPVTPVGSCRTIPANFAFCSGSPTPVNPNTSSVLDNLCSTHASCTYYCPSPFNLVGATCVRPSSEGEF